LYIGNSVHETLKNIQHIKSLTDNQSPAKITLNKMIQTEDVDSNIIPDENNMEIRTFDECLDIYKTQVN
jgi:hypothetical protein